MLNKTAIANSDGLLTIENIPAGKFEVTFSHVGFEEAILSLRFHFPKTAL